mmetsp:Transcript_3610/g.8295  ORF Transcript_3610/g.8295 Transcript_3610/m.8295 type:complete len:138 (-) Transcript_3610:946-1359(-)
MPLDSACVRETSCPSIANFQEAHHEHWFDKSHPEIVARRNGETSEKRVDFISQACLKSLYNLHAWLMRSFAVRQTKTLVLVLLGRKWPHQDNPPPRGHCFSAAGRFSRPQNTPCTAVTGRRASTVAHPCCKHSMVQA